MPDYEGYIETLFPKTLDKSYWDYGLWGKIKCVMTKKKVEVFASSLQSLAETDLSDVDKIVIMNYPGDDKLQYLEKLPKEKLISLVFEPPSVSKELHDNWYFEHFSQVMTWDDDRIDGQKFVKFHYPVMYPMKRELVNFHDKKQLCMIARNKRSDYLDEIYSMRRSAIEHFEHSGEFDLFGYGWENEGYACYRGSIPTKYETLINYKYSLCFENTQNIKGYITEKIFDCFHVGCVPIYLGASNITDYIPANCFIDMRRFSSFEALSAHLHSISEHEYEAYLDHIRQFLTTEIAKKYTDEQFVADFCRVTLQSTFSR